MDKTESVPKEGFPAVETFFPTLDPDAERARAALVTAFFLVLEIQKYVDRDDKDNAQKDLDTLRRLLWRRIDESGILKRLQSTGFPDAQGTNRDG